MSTLLDSAKQHFQDLLHQHQLLKLHVPQWQLAGKTAIIYFQPLATLTVKQFSELSELAKKARVEDFVDILILRAVDAEGQSLFKKTERLELLRHVSPQIICRIVAQMGEMDNSLDEVTSLEKKAS
ncbi:MAG: hypothetical protein V3V61_07400 [Gammaproteobacteria bacterium]